MRTRRSHPLRVLRTTHAPLSAYNIWKSNGFHRWGGRLISAVEFARRWWTPTKAERIAGRPCSQESSRVIEFLAHQASLLVAVQPVTIGITEPHTVRFSPEDINRWTDKKIAGNNLRLGKKLLQADKRYEEKIKELETELARSQDQRFKSWFLKFTVRFCEKERAKIADDLINLIGKSGSAKAKEPHRKLVREEPRGRKQTETDQKHLGTNEARRVVPVQSKMRSEQLIQSLREEEQKLKKEMKRK
ncbi:hypothetical protein P171DRAFT_33622 [Karstenula rhodostoma CBS 690.94]|uniref:Uncharacterized protein n=1 Tax=Karstenula rhodostoma CBS 690.94 TaxID=1392251 RepID=A0A9P4PI95_9PLEO|nr:hypothetical protein P171DRAFT_33622 [Karstenula rhodostoma CBS 690.94]